MKATLFILALCLALPAAAQRSKQEQCSAQAGGPGNPTYDAVYKKCMGEAAKPPAAAGATRPRTKEEQCRSFAGEPGNPTYEAVFKKCLAEKR
jgi:hypothetical protein